MMHFTGLELMTPHRTLEKLAPTVDLIIAYKGAIEPIMEAIFHRK